MNKIEKFYIREEESIISIICNKEFLAVAKNELIEQRNHIKNYISKESSFKTTFNPFKINHEAPLIIRKMIRVSKTLNIGPMAVVAGAISEMIAKKLMKSGAEEFIIDNGGDIAMCLKKPFNIGLYTGNSNINGYGFRIKHINKLIGICTSSGMVGHSKSFGISYATTVFSNSPSFADGAATKIGNEIKKDHPDCISSVLEANIQNKISGIVVTTKNFFGKIGNIPEIIKIDNCFSSISRG